MKHLLAVLLVGAFAASGNDGMVSASARPAPKLSPAALPAQVTTLRVSAVTDTTVVLTWTEVSTGGTGIAKYAVRYGQLGAFTWTPGTDVTAGGCGTPIYGSTAGGGRTRSCVLGGLTPNLAYEFQIVAYTGVLNSTAVFGPLSNRASATTAQRIGPMLVLRPRMLLDTLAIAEASLTYDFGPRRFPLRGRFPAGDRVASFYDSTGALVAFGYLLLVRP
jgi:hypothetical protein